MIHQVLLSLTVEKFLIFRVLVPCTILVFFKSKQETTNFSPNTVYHPLS